VGELQHLQVETRDHITTIRLDRPSSLNALNEAMTLELAETFERLEPDAGTRVVVLTGNGRGFCAGADVGELAAAAAAEGGLRPAAVRERLRAGAVRLATAVWTFDKPIVAAVNGPCAGAGVGIALACDFILAADDASFGLLFARRGLVPDYGVTYLLPRLIGLRRARELCLLGERISAAEAERAGLVTRVVAADTLLDDAAEVARSLAAGPGVALRLTKRLLAESFDGGYGLALDREFTAQALCLASEDAAEGARAFLEKRAPTFAWR
jgi:2-(1,2-epoxy-1,2-dihydrophenyl)acetyl-CoA isomerase